MSRNRLIAFTWLSRLWHMIVPPIPDFFGMLEAQADNLRATVATLTDYLQECDQALASRIHAQVEHGHNLRDGTLARLYRSFITPIDREDIYTLATTIDHILDYIKNTVREIEVLQVPADDWMRRMAEELTEGVASLALGLARFRAGQTGDVNETVQTRNAERSVEDLYRDALDTMFQGEDYQKLIQNEKTTSVHDCLEFVVTRIKRREVYRHLSNAADRLAHAGESLRNIAIKYDSGGTSHRR